MRNILSVVGSAFLNGALGWAATHLTDARPSNGAQIAAFAVGAGLAGVIAVMHLYQPVPSSAPAALPPTGGVS